MIVIGAFGGSTEELDLWSEVADNHMASGIRRCLGLPGAPYTPICSNGNDDDNDTWTDYPLDTDCADPNDTSEESFQIYQCSDGEDNDDDTRTDAADWQCIASDDDDEEN
jgi:hypothetical protein